MTITGKAVLNTGLGVISGPVVTGIYTLATGIGWNSFAGYLTIVLGTVSMTLIVVGLLLKPGAKPSSQSDNTMKVFRSEAELQTEIKRLITAKDIHKVQLISAGVVSRRELIVDCLRAKVSVQLVVQNPDICVSNIEKITTIKALHDIVAQVESDKLANTDLQIRFYNDRASMRLIILKDRTDLSACAFLGWYTYLEQNTLIQGSTYPSLFVQGSDGEPLLRFANKEFTRKWESGSVLTVEAIKKQYSEGKDGSVEQHNTPPQAPMRNL
jgi:hypothetical protein